MTPIAAAADLDINLVTNPGFENVNFGTTGGYGGPMILDWGDGTNTTPFAYSHDGSMGIPDYANGGVYTGGMAPAGTGSYYFSSNSGTDVLGAGQVSQNIDVSTGDTGTLIASGEAAVRLSAFFSSFATNGDFGTLHVNFLNGGGASLGTAEVSDSDVSTWTLDSSGGLIPVGTATARVSVFGTALSGGPDGYIDNVDVQVTSVENVLVILEVNTSTGVATMRNNTGADIHIDYYEIMSNDGAGDSLDAGNWNSLQNQNLPSFPAGNGTGNGWEEADASDSDTLSESYLTGNSAFAHQSSINLGAIFDTGDPQDLTFRYSVVSGGAALTADFDTDSDVDGKDFLDWQTGFPGTFDATDLANWQAQFGGSGGPSGPGVLTTGFVRYVTSGASAVPEPGSMVLVGIGLATLLAPRTRS